ncbi:GGDEF domain-containing protein [Clostridium sp. 'deep sea']|uniref:GGDEF domain-containing protein n=1 Tax=Clostridium sp. 'deep sea' TaxID=2779445 RepID=UPI0018965277|nr:GGDEF domain-containing protein [Clostridium sp. 'deep sea']QOR33896.1 GGDEF domain-containing protein [Clostridium sp. 'deep sea']
MKKKVIIAINLILLITIVGSIAAYFSSIDYLNNSNKLLSISASKFTDGTYTLKSRPLTREQFGIYNYSTTFNKSNLPPSNKEYSVIVTRLCGQSFKVYLNGVYLGCAGDYEAVNSSVWNGMYNFQFDKRVLKSENTLTLQIVGLYEIGLNDYPVVITDYQKANYIQALYSLSHSVSKTIGFGVLISCSFIMLMFYFIFKKSPRRKTFLYMSMALICSIVYLIDLFSLQYIPVNFLLYKKLTITFLYLTLFFIILGYKEYYKVARLRIYAYITLIISIFAAVFSKDIVQFKKWYDIYIVLVPLNIIALKLEIGFKKNRPFSGKLINICTTYALIMILPVVGNRIFKVQSNLFYSIIPVFLIPVCISIIVIIMAELNRLQFMASSQNKRYKYFYNKSITDGLTGLYNYSFMLDYLEKIEPIYTVFIFDIDNLKDINDTLGHLAGNSAILMITNTLKNLLPKNAVAGRFGGDEFMVIIFGDELNTQQILENVRVKIADTKLKSTNLRVTLSIGMYKVTEKESAESIIEKADKAMYYAKKSGKNCLVDYQNIIAKIF